jgi:molecular chaperone GrpE (heat shock protein)
MKGTHNMTQDRNYLRMLSDGELVRTALDRNHELAVVLAERLSELLDVEDQLEDAKKLIDELSDSRDSWMEETVSLQAQLNAK